MTFTYTTTSPATRDKVRLFVGDTNESRYMFEDEELDTLISEAGGSTYDAAALVCRVIATDRAKQAIFVTLPGVSITKSQIPGIYEARAKAFEDMAARNADADSVSVYTETDTYLDSITGRSNVELELPGSDA